MCYTFPYNTIWYSHPGVQHPKNPFTYGDLVSDEAFTDRENELAQLTSDLRNGQNVALIAPRRYGKSSLVQAALTPG